ncbi:MAG: HEAT repeat domain-containing protein [Gemmatimonadetes bacterium]|nr:HEAT repeat domain-containing protein [Gemmatimonadota bacterium]
MTARTRWSLVLSVAPVLAVGALAAPMSAQSLRERIRTAPDGDVTFQFALKEDVEVCDHGVSMRGSGWRVSSRSNRPDICGAGEGEVLLKVRDGAVVALDLRPPSIDRSDTDLGFQDAQMVAEYLLGVAAAHPRESVAEDAIAPAAMIDGVTIWSALLDLARDRSVFVDVREQAVFWLSQEAAETATAGLASIAKDDDEAAEVRAAAVFALSQRPDEEGVPILMELAVTSRHARVRESSLFWLAQSKDPRVLPFFESILIGAVTLR